MKIRTLVQVIKDGVMVTVISLAAMAQERRRNMEEDGDCSMYF